MTWNRGDDHERQIIAQTSKDTRRVFVTCSTDDGLTWKDPQEITGDVKQNDWTWYATGPGSGIQIGHGSHKGRLVIPCDHIEAGTKHYYSHIIYSEDHGNSWRLGGTTPRHQVNECEVVELSDGQLMLNMRNYDRTKKNRQVAISDDGGMTWKDQRFDVTLIEPICQAAIERASWAGGGSRSQLLFSNPASRDGRVNMTVRISFDEGLTWPASPSFMLGPVPIPTWRCWPMGISPASMRPGNQMPTRPSCLPAYRCRRLAVSQLTTIRVRKISMDGRCYYTLLIPACITLQDAASGPSRAPKRARRMTGRETITISARRSSTPR